MGIVVRNRFNPLTDRSVAARGFHSGDTLKGMKKKITIIGFCLVALVAIHNFAQSFLFDPAARDFRRNYEQLRPGMTFSQVQNVFGRSPEYTCKYKDAKFVYYLPPTGSLQFIKGKKPNLKTLPASVQTTKQIPYIYESAQLAFNSKGILSAYTLCGDELNIHTSKGNYRGNFVPHLNAAVIKQLTL